MKIIFLTLIFIQLPTFAKDYSICFCKEDLKDFKITSVISIYGEDSSAKTKAIKEVIRGPRLAVTPVVRRIKKICKKEIKRLIRKGVCKYRDSELKRYVK